MNLRVLYESALDDEARARLETERRIEDRYRAMILGILRKGGVEPEEIATMYSDWNAFSGGWDNLRSALEHACEDVAEAASHTGAEVPAIYCGPWPARALSSRCERTEYGNLILLNTGFWIGIRRFAQAIAESTEAILGTGFGGPDVTPPDKIAAEMARMMNQYVSHGDVDAESRVVVMAGPREVLRRRVTLGAICYVIAHEAGHLAQKRPWRGGWRDDNLEFQKLVSPSEASQGPDPSNERDVTRAYSRESIADLIASEILRQPPFSPAPGARMAQALGAMAALALMAADWWRRAAFTDEDLGCSHPVAEHRMAMVASGFASPESRLQETVAKAPPSELLSSESDEVQRVTDRFARWSTQVLGIDACKNIARQRGLGNRGLNPMSLVFMYMTDPSMPHQPSDLVRDAREPKPDHP